MKRSRNKKKEEPRVASKLLIALMAAAALVASLVYFTRGAGGREEHGSKSLAAATRDPASTRNAPVRFENVAKQSREFIGYFHSIQLTPEQEAIKAEALKNRPAACCHESNAYTCCCQCNLSKTVWGLSNYAIAKHDVNAEELDRLVDDWLAFVNPDGYSGNTCYEGGCARQFSTNGCGGMSESDRVL